MVTQRVLQASQPAPHERVVVTAVSVTMLLFLTLDLIAPVGIASGVPYVLPVLISLRLSRKSAPLIVAGLAVLLTILGYLIPSPNSIQDQVWIGLWNRVIAVLAIGATAYLGHRFLDRDRASRDKSLHLQTLVEATPDLIVSIDSQGLISTANVAAARAFGRSATELVGLPLAELFDSPHHSDDGSVIADATELIAGGRSGIGLALIPFGTRPRTVRWTVRELDDKGSRLAVGHDLTDLLNAQDRAVQAERLAAIGQTLATLSHESKNELLAIRFGLEQLATCWDDRESALDLIEGLLESQDRLWRLFEDLRGFAAPIRLKTKRVALPEVWRRAWDSVQKPADREVAVFENLVASDLECTADSFRLEQVFRNLFENAIAACPGSVRVSITCDATSWHGEQALLVAVRDNGPGLPEDVRHRLFEPFFTTKQSGTGLGLALSRRILEAHHGELAVGSSGPGAEFVIRLPRSPVTSLNGTPAAYEEGVPASSKSF